MRTTTSQQGERCLWRRSWSVGIATALLGAAPFVASAQGDGTTGGENSSTTYKSVAELPGRTFEELQAGITTSCSYDDPSKVYFLYNVGSGKFLNMGGYWGTHASMKDYPMPLWTRNGTAMQTFTEVSTPSLNFTQNIAAEGSMLKWVNSGANKTTDMGVFCDRPENHNSNGYDGWFFEATNDGKNTYHIYTYNSTKATSEDDKFYLYAYSHGQATADKNCGADTKEKLFSGSTSDDYMKWRVLTLQDIYKLLEESSEDLDRPIDLSFKLKCPGFERGRTDINEWQVYTSSVASGSYTRIGLEEYNWKTDTKVSTAPTSLSRGTGESYNNGNYKTSPTSYSYTFPYSNNNSQPITNVTDYRRFMGKFFCMDVHGTHGYMYQKMYVKHPGTYVVQCKGYSNTPKAQLFAGVAGTDGGGMGMFDGSKRTTTLSQVSNMTDDEKARLHVADKNMDYAGKEFYETSNYINSVVIEVTKEMISQAGTDGACIALGIYIGNPNDASETPGADEWTVFDDFRVLYASNVRGKDLVLDELRGDLDYLKEGVTYENSILHLAKTFTKDRWNSFVLPVNLTAYQLRTAFGDGVRLARLKTLTETELQFETVKLNENTNIVLEAYKPYIIFPTKTMDQYSPYTATISETNKVVIQGEHFKIPNVTFTNDLSKMDEHWTTKLTHDVGAITAYGTFVRTFDPDATQDQTTGEWSFSEKRGTIREGYDKLVGSYFFDYGNVYYTENPDKVRGLRGFSCWFKPKNDKTKIEVFIDGMKQEAELTAIGELIVGPEAANCYGKNNGVYNLQGQRVGNTTEGLPSGIYIVNGRKHVVR